MRHRVWSESRKALLRCGSCATRRDRIPPTGTTCPICGAPECRTMESEVARRLRDVRWRDVDAETKLKDLLSKCLYEAAAVAVMIAVVWVVLVALR